MNNVILLEKKLEECRKVSIDDMDINSVDDIESFKIDTKKSSRERILDFLNICKNPYIFKVKGCLVKIEFSDSSNVFAENCVIDVFKSVYKS